MVAGRPRPRLRSPGHGATAVTFVVAGVGSTGWTPVSGRTSSPRPSSQAALQQLIFPPGTSIVPRHRLRRRERLPHRLRPAGPATARRACSCRQVGNDYLIGFHGELARRDLADAAGLRPRHRRRVARRAPQRPGVRRPRGARRRIRLRRRRGQRPGHRRDLAHRHARWGPATSGSTSPRSPTCRCPARLEAGLPARRPSLIGGTLNLDAGTGRHTLMISDEASTAAVNALVTEDRARRSPRTAAPTPTAPHLRLRAVGGVDDLPRRPRAAGDHLPRRRGGHLRRRRLALDRLRQRHHRHRRGPRPALARCPHGHLPQHRPRQRRRQRHDHRRDDDLLVVDTQGAYDQNVRTLTSTAATTCGRPTWSPA